VTATDRPVVPLEQALDLAVDLLGEIETAAPSREYYGSLCGAVCRFIRMDRAGIWLYDAGGHDVSLAGAYGVDVDDLDRVDATVEHAPIARRALEEDRVIEAGADVARELPPGLAEHLGLTSLACVPLAAGGNWYGVLLADRGGARFTLTELERHLLYLSGRILGLAAATRISARRQDRARRLADRLNLSREIHERVLQRLFGVSLVLESGTPLDPEARRRCASELGGAVAELRSALQRPLTPDRPPGPRSLREELDRLPRHQPPLPVTIAWAPGAETPAGAEALAVSVLAEAVRNVRKHARPRRVEVEVGHGGSAWWLEVRNDGAVPAGATGAGLGLRLAAFEALDTGGVLEFGPHGEDGWRVRLVVPEDAE
jgi:signal transduction histidine kinase